MFRCSACSRAHPALKPHSHAKLSAACFRYCQLSHAHRRPPSVCPADDGGAAADAAGGGHQRQVERQLLHARRPPAQVRRHLLRRAGAQRSWCSAAPSSAECMLASSATLPGQSPGNREALRAQRSQGSLQPPSCPTMVNCARFLMLTCCCLANWSPHPIPSAAQCARCSPCRWMLPTSITL